jgi:hypothetical protein
MIRAFLFQKKASAPQLWSSHKKVRGLSASAHIADAPLSFYFFAGRAGVMAAAKRLRLMQPG